MSAKKVCVFIGSRANYGRLKSVIEAINEHPTLELQLVVGCSALSLDIPYKIDEKIQCLISDNDTEAMAKTTGVLLTQISTTFARLKPDVILLHGDRYEVLAAATAAAYMNITLAHTEGGEDTGTIDQKVRYAISQFADIHFPVTNKAAKQIFLIGKPWNKIFTVGSTALDTIKDIDLSNNRKEPYVVILHHPNTTYTESFIPLIEAVNRIDIHKVWVNPNTDAGSKQMLKLIHQQNVEFVKDLQPEEYARLLNNCKCAIGNSSSFIKEGAFLGVPGVIIGKRQDNREHCDNVIFTDYNPENILEAVNTQLLRNKRYPQSYMFGDGTAASKIVEVLSCLS